MNHIFFTYFSTNRHLGCSHILAIVNNAAMDTKVHASFQIMFFPHICLEVGLLGHMVVLDCVDHNKLWKILKEMGIPDHLTCLLRNLYAVQEATVKTGHGVTD